MDTNFISIPIISLRDPATFLFMPLVLQVAESRNCVGLLKIISNIFVSSFI